MAAANYSGFEDTDPIHGTEDSWPTCSSDSDCSTGTYCLHTMSSDGSTTIAGMGCFEESACAGNAAWNYNGVTRFYCSEKQREDQNAIDAKPDTDGYQ